MAYWTVTDLRETECRSTWGPLQDKVCHCPLGNQGDWMPYSLIIIKSHRVALVVFM